MVATSYRFLPWARRGLAAHVDGADDHGTLPARAEVTVALTVSSIPEARQHLALYGPGDVIGLDPRLIVRVSPRADSTDVEPNFFAAVEFDPPDLPWLFTPASPPSDERLRPWLVLAVVDLDVVPAPRTQRGKPLPELVVPPREVATQLPDLGESWAWAHAQVVAPAGGTDVAAALSGDPALNVSRIVAPRRLEPGKRYAACLVPAFDAGVRRGLGEIPDPTRPLGPAWTTGVEARLPVYFHWEFATGPQGDFESLARRLRPFRAPVEIGSEALQVDDPALPAAVLQMDGALRAPKRTTSELAEVPAPLREALAAVLNSAGDQARGDGDAPPLGPPLYGAFHAGRHRLDDDAPLWLGELNLDPRARAAAGLGAEIERAHQEELMQWCWEQVGRILEANRLMSRARLSLEVLERVHARHVKPLPPGVLFAFAGPLLGRTPAGLATVTALVARSSLPDAAADPALRRLTSPRRQALRTALARTGAPVTAAPTRLVTRLAAGALDVDPTRFVPDGLVAARGLSAVAIPAGGDAQVDLRAAGIAGQAPADLLRDLAADAAAASDGPPPVIKPRPDLSSVGIVVRGPFDLAASAPTPLRPGGTPQLDRAPRRPRDPTDPDDDAGPTRPPRPRRVNDSSTLRRLRSSLALAAPGGVFGTAPPVRSLVTFDVATTSSTLLARTQPRVTVTRRLTTMLLADGRVLLDDPPEGVRVAATQDRVLAAPELDLPVADLLARLDQTRFLPGADAIPEEAITLLETNPRFVVALLAGLNTEMNRELLWREFPTDQRGTPFRHFWRWADGLPDVPSMTAWHEGLAHVARDGPGGQIALLVRGRLLRRYPSTVVYAWRSDADGELVNPPGPGDLELPVFSGVLGDDIVFHGFDLTDTQLTEGAGWFFVLQEQPTEPRFGLDEPPRGNDTPGTLDTWSDATWAHAGTAPGGYLTLAGNPLEGTVLGNVRFVDHAGCLAAITLQKPFRVAVHARSLVEPEHTDG